MSYSSVDVNRRIRKNSFLPQMSFVLNWNDIENLILKYYNKGKSVDGRPSYSGLLLFKMLLLEYWYNLSDVQVEEMVNENLSAMVFCGLDLEDEVPDNSTISRFRSTLSKQNAFETILEEVNRQLIDKGIFIIKGAAMVDASITDSPRKPKGKTTYEIAEDRKEDERKQEDIQTENEEMSKLKKLSKGVDSEARWLRKAKQLRFGFKKHFITNQDGLVDKVHSTTANEHDSKGFKPLIDKIDPTRYPEGYYTDKGYCVPQNDQLLKDKKKKNRIQRKAYRNKPLTSWEKKFNKLIAQKRWVVERTFGSIKRWFGETQARFVGLEKTHTQHLLQAISHNLYRAPGIVASNLEKFAIK